MIMKMRPAISLISTLSLWLVLPCFATTKPVPRQNPPSTNEVFISAAEAGDTVQVLDLLAKGADINAGGKDGWTALMRASSKGRLNTVRTLMERGADVNVKVDPSLNAL